jgi:hypothetical protein
VRQRTDAAALRVQSHASTMKTLIIALASVLGQSAFASECAQTGAWVVPPGVMAVLESADPGQEQPGKAATARETFITQVGQDNRGYWTMTKEDVPRVQVDDRHSTAFTLAPRVCAVTHSPEAR